MPTHEPRGTAETALLAAHGDTIAVVSRLLGEVAPPPQSSSALAWSVDRAVGRDVADVSALAAHHRVAVGAVLEQPLTLSRRRHDGTPEDGSDPSDGLTGPAGASSSWTPDGSPVVGTPATETAAAAVHAAVATLNDTVVRTEALLNEPRATLARERADLACRAYANGWHAESEGLFQQAIEHLPTEPFFWFGAGLAAAHLDADRAARHLQRCADYLRTADPAGAVYADLAAALILEESGWVDRAGRLLGRTLGMLDLPCPAVSLHLARLGVEADEQLAAALDADPLVEPDAAALGLGGRSRIRRGDLLGQELGSLDLLLHRLRSVDEAPGFIDPDESEADRPGSQPFPLVRLEADLRLRLDRCRQALTSARQAIVERERPRVAKEAELERHQELVAATLGVAVAAPLVLLAAVTVLYALAGLVIGPWAAERWPVWIGLLSLWWSMSQIGLLVLFVWLVRIEVWPRRRFRASRAARVRLPGLEWEAAQLRRSEYDVRQRFNQARDDGDRRFAEILERRRHLVPRRPRYGAVD